MRGVLLAPLAALTVLAFSSGGYFLRSWGIASIALAGLLAIAAVAGGIPRVGRWSLAAMAGWAGLAVWQGSSSAWAAEPAAALDAMNATLLYAAAFVLVLVGVRRASDLRLVIHAATAAAAVVAGAGLLSRLVPSLVGGDTQSRLSAPISYWNGLGVVAAMGLLLALGCAGHPTMRRGVRAAHAALVPLFALVLLLTFSRGAVAALAVAMLLLVLIAPGRIETIAAFALSAGVAVPLLLVANGETSIAVISGPVPPHDAAGRRVLLLLIATMLAAAAVSIAASWSMSRLPGAVRRPLGAGIAALAGVAMIGGLLVAGPDEGPVAWSERQIDQFQSFDVAARNDAASVSDRLLAAAGSGRWQNWQVAAQEFRADPVVGTGAGDYRFWWDERRSIDLTVQNAHSLYLETLGESGLIGLALLLLPVVCVVGAVAGPLRRRTPHAHGRDLGIAVAGGAVVAIHMAGDWDWQLPAVVLPAIVLGAAALRAAELGSARRMAGPTSRAAVAVLALAGIALVSFPVAAALVREQAAKLARDGDLVGALDRAGTARALHPGEADGWHLEANILADLGRPADADRAFASAIARSPRDWTIPADWAAALIARGEGAAARPAARRAKALNPLAPRTDYLVEAAGTTRSGP